MVATVSRDIFMHCEVVATVFSVIARVFRIISILILIHISQKKGIKHRLSSMCLDVFFLYLGALRIIGNVENCKLMVEPFGTTCEPRSRSKSSLISFYSCKTQLDPLTDLLYPLTSLYSQCPKNNSFDSIVLFFDNTP